MLGVDQLPAEGFSSDHRTRDRRHQDQLRPFTEEPADRGERGLGRARVGFGRDQLRLGGFEVALGDDLLLDLARQVVPDRLGAVRRVEQEHGAGNRRLQHVETVEKIELVAGDEIGPADEIGGKDRPRPEAQM